MRTANEHIVDVMGQYGLGDHGVLRTVDKLHVERTGDEPCVDHATFVAAYGMRHKFIKHWERKGLKPVQPLITTEFPAEHIALVRGDAEYEACDSMIGLSVSADANSPLNKLMRYPKPARSNLPGTLQHVAVNIDPSVDMEQFFEELEANGIRFMTPLLVSRQARFRLSQAFTATTKPFGHFVEIIQRKPDEAPADAEDAFFNTRQIDALIRCYKEHSEKLLRV